MATIFVIKQNDTRPKVVATLSGFSGGVTLATATTVKMFMRLVGGQTISLTGTTVITSAAQNQVTFTWGTSDTATIGTYEVEWEILWSDGGRETVPNDGYNTITVVDDIGNQP